MLLPVATRCPLCTLYSYSRRAAPLVSDYTELKAAAQDSSVTEIVLPTTPIYYGQAYNQNTEIYLSSAAGGGTKTVRCASTTYHCTLRAGRINGQGAKYSKRAFVIGGNVVVQVRRDRTKDDNTGVLAYVPVLCHVGS